MILHLGVHDIAYAAPFIGGRKPKKGTMAKARKAYGAGKSTGDVAEILEKKYAIMAKFYEMEKGYIIGSLDKSMTGALKNIMMGQPYVVALDAQAMSAIAARFKNNLSRRAYDGKILGVPTKAAQAGVSHRFQRPYAKRSSRPSFIDTGQYQASFVSWIGEK